MQRNTRANVRMRPGRRGLLGAKYRWGGLGFMMSLSGGWRVYCAGLFGVIAVEVDTVSFRSI